jgi:hypothetical protein
LPFPCIGSATQRHLADLQGALEARRKIMLFNVVVNTKEKLGQVFYESAIYYAKLCDIFVLKYIRLRKFYKILMLSSTLVVGYISLYERALCV